MVAYRLSAKADADIDAIYEYSVLNFGLETARKYLDALSGRFDLLAAYPQTGKDYGFIRAGLRRFEHTSHSVYYTVDDRNGVLIVRVLGARQDPARHI